MAETNGTTEPPPETEGHLSDLERVEVVRVHSGLEDFGLKQGQDALKTRAKLKV